MFNSLITRIGLVSAVVLLLFMASILAFLHANRISAELVRSLQEVNRAQAEAGELRQQIDSVNRQLLAMEALADPGREIWISESEQASLHANLDNLADGLERVDGILSAHHVSPPSPNAIDLLLQAWREQVQVLSGQRASATDDPEEPIDLPSLLEQARKQVALKTDQLRRVSGALNDELDHVVTLSSRLIQGVFVISLLIVIGAGYPLVRHIRRSLRALTEGSLKWSAGQTDHRVPDLGRDELGELGQHFNRMAAQIEEGMAQLELARTRADNANQSKSEFLANMSHELRTPMNAIIGYSEMILEEAEEDPDARPEEFKADIGKILGAGQHLLALINDILDISKIEAGKMTLFVEPTDLIELIEETMTTVRPLIEKNGNTLEFRHDLVNSRIKTDQTKLRQILLNLLSNAAKFTRDGRITISVDSRQEGDHEILDLAVADTGIGMDAQQQARIFEAFTQADSSTTREFGGTGLGLTICKRFAELMNGDLVVDSTPGEGTRFTLSIPAGLSRQSVDDQAPVDQAQLSAESADSRGITVLVIDDDPTARDIAGRILRNDGFEVLVAESGQRGLELARQARPDLIVLDVMMPGLDGWEVLESLKESPDTAMIPVVMQSMLDERQTGLDKGADDYLTKPIDRRKLSRAIRRLLPESDGGRVLLIADDADSREQAAALIKGAETEIIQTGDLVEAEALIRKETFSMIMIGQHAGTEEVGRFMLNIQRTAATRAMPMLLLKPSGLEEAQIEQLRSLLNQQSAS